MRPATGAGREGLPDMATSYTSFLIRHWTLTEGGSRVTIEHIQTGEAVAVATLDEALVWLGGRATHDAPPPAPGAAGEARAAGDDVPTPPEVEP